MTWSELGVVILPLVRTSVWRRAPPEQQRVAATYCRRVDWRYEILKAFLQAYCKQTSTFPKQFYVQPYRPGPYPPNPGTEWITLEPKNITHPLALPLVISEIGHYAGWPATKIFCINTIYTHMCTADLSLVVKTVAYERVVSTICS